MGHHYAVDVVWTGNRGTGTSGYRAYDRDHTVTAEGAGELLGSADPTFRGDSSRWNPEQLLLAALSQCHLLSFLHVCVRAQVVVTDYTDHATATMAVHPDGSGEFVEAVLAPQVAFASPVSEEQHEALHVEASSLCFIARSVNFPVRHQIGRHRPA